MAIHPTRSIRIGKPRRIALVGLPMLQLVAPAYCRVLQKYADEHQRWKFICNLEATPKAFKVIRMLDCDGVIARMISPKMKRAARNFSTLACITILNR